MNICQFYLVILLLAVTFSSGQCDDDDDNDGSFFINFLVICLLLLIIVLLLVGYHKTRGLPCIECMRFRREQQVCCVSTTTMDESDSNQFANQRQSFSTTGQHEQIGDAVYCELEEVNENNKNDTTVKNLPKSLYSVIELQNFKGTPPVTDGKVV